TIFGIALNSALALPAYEAVFHLLHNQSTPEPTLFTVFLLLNVIVTPIYCWGASLIFQPKRLVNPLHIQLATAGIVTILITFANVRIFPQFQLQLFYNFIGSTIGTLIAAIIQFGIFGVSQLFVVRWLVGLTGGMAYLAKCPNCGKEVSKPDKS
ncbi:MAG: hypothetical protein ACXV2C_09145, partial [Candidatus Bathyarchaeia archaeon]